MKSSYTESRSLKKARCSALALAAALAWSGAASAQTAIAPEDAPEAAEQQAGDEIVVTGSRVDRAGFDAPTPTTVIGDVELRQGARASIAQVLNDQPQFRATSTPASTTGNTSSSASTADLRGLGAVRTLTLLNGRRFTGSADLNNIPMGLVKRVEVVTGGASAAWGSGAVAGVVNILLDDNLKGLTLGADAGISSRGDGFRYGFNGTFGTSFADDRGHFMIAAQYLDDKGAFDRKSRPNLNSGLFSRNGRLSLERDVNVANASTGGLVMSGVLAGQTFNSNGTLSPFGYGSIVSPNTPGTLPTSMIGGDGRATTDYLAASSPFERTNVFARASYELSDAAKFWIDGGFTRIQADFGFFPDIRAVSPASGANAAAGGLLIQRDNAYLSSAIRNQLTAAGQTSFRMGRILADIGDKRFLNYAYTRDNIEGAIGVDGSLGGWKYSAYYGHGELKNRQTLQNQRIVANFNNAIDAVISPVTGQAVCRIALTDPTTACRPLNLFGEGNASAEAVAYAFGDGGSTVVTKLDTTGVSLRGDLFSTWAGPVSVAIGGEARWESTKTTHIDPLSRAGALGILNFSALNGGFNVKEGFAEVVVPLLNMEGTATLDLNGAARYSDYSNSGGIWSWKAGATSRLFDSLLVRAVRSRDIRSPSITELFTTRTTNIGDVSDPFRNNEVASGVFRYGGGNPDLVPEIAHTTTIGASFSPRFVSGLNLSVDFYKIDIDKVIGALSSQDIVNQCFKGNAGLCDQIVRDGTGKITTVFATNLNLASYKTRGIDFEASYQLPLEKLSGNLPGSLRFRALATYVDRLLINDGVNTYDRAGDVGDNAAFTTPKWRGTGSITYQSDAVNVDLRARYVGGGQFNSLQNIVNNKINSRTYVDLGAQFNVTERFTLTATVNNLFDRDPPYITYSSAIYDVMGRYFQVGAKVRF